MDELELKKKEFNKKVLKFCKELWESRSPGKAKFLWEEHRNNSETTFGFPRGFDLIEVTINNRKMEITGSVLQYLANEYNWK